MKSTPKIFFCGKKIPTEIHVGCVVVLLHPSSEDITVVIVVGYFASHACFQISLLRERPLTDYAKVVGKMRRLATEYVKMWNQDYPTH
jgi:hypothetical protein